MSGSQGASRTASSDFPDSISIVADAAEALKATDLLVLDLRELASFTDYLAICTGSSDRHVQAVVDAIRERLKEAGVAPHHTEGYEKASWVLVDFVDFLVNVFTPEARDFYQLDRVWRDAPVVVGERPRSSSDGEARSTAAQTDGPSEESGPAGASADAAEEVVAPPDG